jgi:Phycobilisome degradation protein nblA
LINLELRIEQKFDLERYRRQLPGYTHDQLQEMVGELTKQLMVKDNIVRQLLRGGRF